MPRIQGSHMGSGASAAERGGATRGGATHVAERPCGSPSGRLYSGNDTQEYSISGAGWNDPGNDRAGDGIHRRRIRRCARSDSGDEIADIFHLCLRWSEYGGVSVCLSQSAVLNAAATLSDGPATASLRNRPTWESVPDLNELLNNK